MVVCEGYRHEQQGSHVRLDRLDALPLHSPHAGGTADTTVQSVAQQQQGASATRTDGRVVGNCSSNDGRPSVDVDESINPSSNPTPSQLDSLPSSLSLD